MAVRVGLVINGGKVVYDEEKMFYGWGNVVKGGLGIVREGRAI